MPEDHEKKRALFPIESAAVCEPYLTLIEVHNIAVEVLNGDRETTVPELCAWIADHIKELWTPKKPPMLGNNLITVPK